MPLALVPILSAIVTVLLLAFPPENCPVFSFSAIMTRMRTCEIDREWVMCPSCVLINHATREIRRSMIRDTPFFLLPAFPTLLPVEYSSGYRKLVLSAIHRGRERKGYRTRHVDRSTPDAIWQEVYRRRINSNSLASIWFLWRSPTKNGNWAFHTPRSTCSMKYRCHPSLPKWHLGLIQPARDFDVFETVVRSDELESMTR